MNPFPELSPQLARVAMLIASDENTRAIAADLGVRVSTAHTYRYDVFRKLEVNGAAGVAAIAFRRGYIAP